MIVASDSYILRIDIVQDGDAEATLRIMLSHVETGARRRFATFEALTTFLDRSHPQLDQRPAHANQA